MKHGSFGVFARILIAKMRSLIELLFKWKIERVNRLDMQINIPHRACSYFEANIF